jgi:hypothetical protein
VLIITAGVTFNWVVNGTPVPNTYLARHQDLGLFPVPNLWNVWLGYFHHLSFLSGLAWLISLPIIVGGAWAIVGKHRFSAVPLVFFVPALAYAAAVAFERPGTEWSFSDRRHMDAAIPFVVVALAAGVAWMWQVTAHWKTSRMPEDIRERRTYFLSVNALRAVAVLVPLIALPFRWNELTADYSWNSANVWDVNVAAGQWLEENTPADAVMGAAPAGAVRFFSNRTVLDIDGSHTHEALDFTPLEFAEERNVDYLAGFRNAYFDSVPGRPVVYEVSTPFNSVLPSDTLRIYGPANTTDEVFANRSEMLVFDSSGLDLIDMIDPGNLSAPDEINESSHSYRLEGVSSTSDDTYRSAEAVTVSDDARVFSVAEEFTVNSRPGRTLVVVKRYDAAIGGSLNVFANGSEAGAWDLPVRPFFFGESAFEVPAELITGEKTTLRFEVVPTGSASAGNSYFIWVLAPRADTS